jgi:UDP-N-acetylmuramoylalanine--D-glutamate ligase
VRSLVSHQLRNNANTILIVGLGKTGYSAVSHYVGLDYQVTIADSRQAPPYLSSVLEEFPQVNVHCGEFDEELFASFAHVLISPGVPLEDPAVQSALNAGADVFGDVELFARMTNTPVIAITGSNGKSTVTQLSGDMLAAAGHQVQIGGNLGIPVLELMQRPAPAVYVLELSSFQLETTHSLRPVAACVLNISEDHMDRYSSLISYAGAKTSVYWGASNCVVNRDCHLSQPNSNDGDAQWITFGLGEPASFRDFGISKQDDGEWIVQGRVPVLRCTDLVLQGNHNILNVQAALALIRSAGFEITEAMLQCARQFGGLPHRMQVVEKSGGVNWINDSKGTNVGATSAALTGLDSQVILIAGGQGKSADFSPLVEAAQDTVKLAVLFGEDAKLIESEIQRACPTQLVADLKSAVCAADAAAKPGDVVLFSPACASFDMFENFEARGLAFSQCVEELVACRQ